MNKREIKFRGKRIDNGNWIYGYYVSIASTHKIVSFNPDSPSFATYYDVDSSSVGQYTGLIDRNGKAVFEGDIVEYKNNVGIVTYYEGRGQFQVKVKGQPPITMHNKKVAIIDNIHGNTGKQKEDKQA
jgi:uncharacterized phage protein (TIGR01671 family)